MPTVMQFNGLRVVIYYADHDPAHVHVLGAGNEARINIITNEVMSNFGFSRAEIRTIKAEIAANQQTLLQRWIEFNGQAD